MTEPPHLRLGSSSDASDLALLGRLTFRATFAADNTSDDMERYLSEAFAEDRVQAELADPDVTYLVAERDSKLLGYAKLRAAAETPAEGPRPVELQRLYAHPEAIGAGVGSALMERCLEEAKAQGFLTLWLGVWERNARALAFYERWGFVATGEHVFQLGADAQRDVIMERALG